MSENKRADAAEERARELRESECSHYAPGLRVLRRNECKACLTAALEAHAKEARQGWVQGLTANLARERARADAAEDRVRELERDLQAARSAEMRLKRERDEARAELSGAYQCASCDGKPAVLCRACAKGVREEGWRAGLNQRLELAEARDKKLTKACEEYAAALSRIDYLCEMKPNDMEVSGYDVHCDDKLVVKAVERVVARVRELERERDEARADLEWYGKRVEELEQRPAVAHAAGWRAGRDATIEYMTSNTDGWPCSVIDGARALEPGGGE